MKGVEQVYQVHPCLSILLLCTIFLISVVSGDIAVGTITHVYFQKDDIPYNGSVHYTVACYGYEHDYTSRDQPPLERSGYVPQEVYQYSATCGHPGCVVYEPYYMINSGGSRWLHLDRCDLQGETTDGTFFLRNFSDKPYSSCTWLPRYYSIKSSPSQRIFYGTEEYAACKANRSSRFTISHEVYSSCNPATETGCYFTLLSDDKPLRLVNKYITEKNGTSMDPALYIGYLKNCDPEHDPDCPGMVIDGTPLKNMAEYRPSRIETEPGKDPCLVFLAAANPALVIPEHACNQSGCEGPMAQVLCELRVTIPSANLTTVTAPVYSGSLPRQHSPVESLYCSLLRLIGGGCE